MTWVPFAVAVTGIAAAVGVALGNASLTWHFGAADPAAPLRSAAARVVAPSTPVVSAPAARLHETTAAPLETRSRSGALAVPEVRYEDLPVLQKDAPSGTDTRAAGTRRHRVKAHAR